MIWRPYPIRQADSLPASVPVLHQHQASLHQGLYAAAKSGIYFKRAERTNFAFYHPPMDRVPLNKIDLSLIKFLPLSNCPLQLCHDIYTHTIDLLLSFLVLLVVVGVIYLHVARSWRFPRP